MTEQIFQCNPMCPVPDIKDDIGELKVSVSKLHEKQDKIAELAIALNFIQKQIDELKRSDDELFTRMRTQEKVAVSWNDVAKIITVVSVVTGGIVAGIGFIMKLARIL